MLETADTSRDDLAILSYTSELQGTLKLLHILMDGVMHIYKWHLNIGYALKKMILFGATAAPGWQKWVWSPFLSILGTGQQRLSIMGVSNQKHILNYYKIIKSMCFVVRQLSIV